MTLRSITYMSSAVRLLLEQELDDLLIRARRRNEVESVTGVLLYDAGNFLQVIEGPESGLARVYSAIMADRMHHNVFELLNDPIEYRAFPHWSMAYLGVGAASEEPPADLLSGLAAPPGELSGVRHLLAAFWNQGRGARYGAPVTSR